MTDYCGLWTRARGRQTGAGYRGFVPDNKPAPSTRPSDRREQILAAAARLFHARGYVQVSLDDIASEVSISAPALYRHFPGKQALLLAVVDDALSSLESVIGGSASARQLAGSVSAYVVEHGDFGVLLVREIDCLEDAARLEAHARFDGIVDAITAVIVSERPWLDSEVAVALARTALAIATSTSYNPSGAGTSALGAMIERLLLVVCSELVVDIGDFVEFVDQRPQRGLSQPWLSRSEAIMAAAPWLLTMNGGYSTTTLEDLGAAAGISGAGIYTYFSSKADLFHAVSVRGMTWATSDLEKALAMSTSGPDTMYRAIESFAKLAGWFTDVALSSDTLSLSERQRSLSVQQRTEYMGLWLDCLRATRPDLALMEQGIVLTAVIAATNELSGRRRRSSQRPDDSALATMIVDLLLAI